MLDSFEELKDMALKNLEKCLSSEKMNELSDFAMFVETNRDSEKRISLGKLVDPPPQKKNEKLIRSQTSSMAQNLSQEKVFNEIYINCFLKEGA